ncbi:hypothetical protein M441DRAFT_90633 [Trichoderma asperellum CBS 433.97]|uniref:Uncharacterized protein n=1 Tax=Trichoderma asperellum (strain ATCC 204424 / CBS 433.97 / NBRC 101777) TaxID=1042311 RepID=A0A2T3Z6G3_TRIA4|nr:hypothetical protein M441DRAFT_90633 [Trichoderma asperellum CBS 433.97]PTB40382.1 hypothetical protein M441DRAFT_90633 [Trichoderma asperellum CBS 433.97]
MADSGVPPQARPAAVHRSEQRARHKRQCLIEDVTNALSIDKKPQRNYKRNAVEAAKDRYTASSGQNGGLPGLGRRSLDVIEFTKLIRCVPFRLITKLKEGIPPEVKNALSQYTLSQYTLSRFSLLVYDAIREYNCRLGSLYLTEILPHLDRQTAIEPALVEESRNTSTELHFQPADSNVALCPALDKAKPIIQNYLYVGLTQSNRRKAEGNRTSTDTIELYLPSSMNDAWLKLWVCSAIGMRISEAKDMPELIELRAILGDYLWECLESSQLRKEEIDKGASMGTHALKIGTDGADYVIFLALGFDAGWDIFSTLFPMPG